KPHLSGKAPLTMAGCGCSRPTDPSRRGSDLRCWTPGPPPLILHAMTPQIRALTALLALVLVATPCVAQTAADPDSGTFVVRHDSDSVAVEHFSRTATKLQGTLAVRDAKGTAQ